VRDLESWLEEQTVRQAATPLATESVAALQLQLQENKVCRKTSLVSDF